MSVKSPEIPELVVKYCKRVLEQIGGLDVKDVSFTVGNLPFRRDLNMGSLNIEVDFPFDINRGVINALLILFNSVLFECSVYSFDYYQKMNGILRLSLIY